MESVVGREAWGRIEREARRHAARKRLSWEATEDLMQEVALAAWRDGNLGSAGRAERFAGVVADRVARRARRAERRNAAGVGLSADLPDRPADGSDDPETRAVLRAGASAEMARLSAAHRRALAYPLGPVAPTRAEQNRLGLRLIRARERVAEAVRDLLAPACVRLSARARHLHSLLADDPAPALASLAAALVAGAVLGTLGASAAATAGPHPAPPGPTRRAEESAHGMAPATRALSVARPALKPSGAPPTGLRPPVGRGAAPPVAAVAVEASLQKSDSSVDGWWRLTLSSDGAWGRDTTEAGVNCRSEVGAALCPALPRG
jgi:hypothetical protein